MAISVQELVTILMVYAAFTGSGLYWLWHRAMSQGERARWAVALVVMPLPAVILLGIVRPGWRQYR